ncbi:phenylalanine--tRNA ligase subunit beta [Aidingimonas lacisalsi]|uniref:phenylalanine--tRNA ligase subunit beta n=1 Tax=Aidingimonas lacisalsi TaxID=2604086 RepID=UPI0011D1DE3C|nr:phenylalanine--tRNA ligase subunit beta [Aidingimonas lacisalsi]
MKFSEQWLREWVSPALSTQALADQITMAGLEVDAIEPVAGTFSQVVVAEVIEKRPHPDADKLSVCRVDDGSGGSLQVVCGAPNVAEGQKVAFARVGAVLPDEMQIRETRVRGTDSQGMICSSSELGLSEETSQGILELASDAPVGSDFRDWMGLEDVSIEVDLTPNRGDCLSIRGLAREVGVLNQLDITGPSIDAVSPAHEDTFDVRVMDPVRCPRYVGRIIKNVDVSVSSPLWMVERLRRSGLRSIDPVVDITNYVMLELGQPMHAFDRANLTQAIEVRGAKSGETLVLLDGQRVSLSEETLIIADANGPLAIAGVMGGDKSGVNTGTRDIFLESAFFTPLAVAGQARQYGLHTDASHRFERGVDPHLSRTAVERATELLLSITGGEAGPVVEAGDDRHMPSSEPITLHTSRLEQALDTSLANSEVTDILERLGLSVTSRSDGWSVMAPSWRFDIAIEEDLVEEVARIHGYNRLPVRRPAARLALRADQEHRLTLSRLRRQMVDRGYQEAISYSFVSPELQRMLFPDAVSPALANPISNDMSVMRVSLFPGLIKALEYNLNRQQTRIRLFETGLVFQGELDALTQVPMLGAVVSGRRDPEGWAATSQAVDFFDLKGDLENLLALGDSEAWRFEPAEHPALHPGQSARLVHEGTPVGWIGTLHPGKRAELGLKTDAILFEVSLSALTKGRVPSFHPLSRYPEVRRDLALLVDEALPVQALLDCLRDAAGEWLSELRLFDVYHGQGVADGEKSVALGLTWQHPSRTLNDDEINQLVDTIIAQTGERFGARLRR